MADLILSGSTSGTVTVSSPAVSGSSVLTLPASTDTLVGKATTDTLTNKTLTAPAISSAVMTTMASSVLTSATAQASTSGTSIDFPSIPSWVKRITVMFNGVSISGTSSYLVQLGSGSIDATTYSSAGVISGSGGAGVLSSTSGFVVDVGTASYTIYGTMTLALVSGSTWVSSHALGNPTTTVVGFFGGGNKTLSGALDRVRITTVNGTDTFDAGSINLLYE